MYNFFAEESNLIEDGYFITGTDQNHIANVLRMKSGDEIYVSTDGRTDLCRITSIDGNGVTAEIVEENAISTELPVKIILFQGIPKGDRMETLIQKTTELGVFEIVPVEMKRSVVKLDEKRKKSRAARWNAIAESAAKQSKRNVIPAVSPLLSFREMLERARECDLFIVPYENTHGMKGTRESISKMKSGMTVGILIGPEGGFEKDEIESALTAGGEAISLGSRILRVETASIIAVAMCMLYTELNGENDERDPRSV